MQATDRGDATGKMPSALVAGAAKVTHTDAFYCIMAVNMAMFHRWSSSWQMLSLSS
jgi:hypothetical protein